MSNVVSLFKGQAGLTEGAIQNIQAVIENALQTVVRDELRPIRELLTSLVVGVNKFETSADQITDALSSLGNADAETHNATFYAGAVSGLALEKIGNEIVATLFDKMADKHPSRLRTFYTDLEREVGIALSAMHKERVQEAKAKESGHYPYRKIDTILLQLDKDYVFEYAKKYKFKTK